MSEQYGTMSLVIKILRDNQPETLYNSISENLFNERRRPLWGKFFNNAHGKIGLHDLKNRLQFIGNINMNWLGLDLSDNAIRTGLKKELNFDFE